MSGGGETGSAAPTGQGAVGTSLALSSGRGRWVVAATVLGSGIAMLDSTVVGIALPSIGRTFHGGVDTLQWVVTGYALTLAAFLLLGGSLGDRYGRKRIFSIGVVWFAAASALCGIAPTAGLLIAARVVQGVGGALLAPASLAILQASFRPDDRAKAIGAWSGLSGVATAAGPLVGGYLIAVGSWRWVFYINLPLSVAVLVITARHVPESRDPTASGRVDMVGAALGVVFLAGLTYGLIEAPARGWSSPAVVACLVVAVLAAPAFLVVEHRRAHPMLPLTLFRSRQFSGANGVTFAVYAALGGALFLLPVELQIVKGYSPLESGIALFPLTLVMLTLSARSGAFSARIGPRLQMTVGPLVVGAGLALLTRATNPGSYWTQVFPAVLIFAVGLAITVGAAHGHGDGRGTARALRRRVGRQQRRRPGRQPPGRGRVAPPGGSDGRRRPAQRHPGRRLPHGHVDLRPGQCGGRRPGRADHPQSGAHTFHRPRPRRARAHLELRCQRPARQSFLGGHHRTAALTPTCARRHRRPR